MRYINTVFILFLITGCSIISRTGEVLTGIDLQQNYYHIEPEITLKNSTNIMILYPRVNIEILKEVPSLPEMLYTDLVSVFKRSKRFRVFTPEEESMEDRNYIYPEPPYYTFYSWFFGNPSHRYFLYTYRMEGGAEVTLYINVREFKRGFTLGSSWIVMDMIIRKGDGEVIYSGRLKGFYKDLLRGIYRELKG